MRLRCENTVRKVDALGRVIIPKSIRDRLNIKSEEEVEFFILEGDDGRDYVCFTNQGENLKYENAAKVLIELGIDLPEELADKLE